MVRRAGWGLVQAEKQITEAALDGVAGEVPARGVGPAPFKTERAVPIRVGDTVSFRFGEDTVVGTVTEDRGNIGVRGRRLYRVEFDDKRFIELPRERLIPWHNERKAGVA